MDIVNSESSQKMKESKYWNKNAKNVLKEADHDELKVLLSKASFSQYSYIRGFVDMQIRYNIFEGTATKFFIPKGDNPMSFLIVYPIGGRQQKNNPQMMSLFWDVDKGNDFVIKDYLSSLPGINWKNPLSILTYSTIVLEKIKPILEFPALCGRPLTRTLSFEGDRYFVEDISLNTSIPEGYTLGRLKPEHASYVHKMVGDPLGESDTFLSKQLTVFPSVALYKISDDGIVDPLPLSWTTVRSHGGIGRTFTMPEFRSRGFATIVTVELINNLLKAENLPIVGISRSNKAAIRAHEKLGFIKKIRVVIATFSSP